MNNELNQRVKDMRLLLDEAMSIIDIYAPEHPILDRISDMIYETPSTSGESQVDLKQQAALHGSGQKAADAGGSATPIAVSPSGVTVDTLAKTAVDILTDIIFEEANIKRYDFGLRTYTVVFKANTGVHSTFEMCVDYLLWTTRRRLVDKLKSLGGEE